MALGDTADSERTQHRSMRKMWRSVGRLWRPRFHVQTKQLPHKTPACGGCTGPCPDVSRHPLEREVAINGKERPADILARRLKGSAPLAIDVTVVHPFTQTSNTPQHDGVSSAELAKHRHYDELCRAIGFSTFGGAAPDAMLVLRHVKNRIMEKHGKSEGHLLCNQAEKESW